jgi:hypothetical protein
MRSIGRVGESEAATSDLRTAPDSPTLTAPRSVPPLQGEGGRSGRIGKIGTESFKQAFDIGCASPYGAR